MRYGLRATLISLAFVALMAGCGSDEADPSKCTSNDQCPTGGVCASGVCYVQAAAGAGGGGGAVDAGGDGKPSSGGASGSFGGTGGDGAKDASVAGSAVGKKCKKTADCGSRKLECIPESSDDWTGGGPAGGYCSASCNDDANVCVALGAACVAVNGDPKKRWCMRICALGPDTDTKLDGDKCEGRGNLGCGPTQAVGTIRTVCMPTCSDDDDCEASDRRCEASLGLCVDSPRSGDEIGSSCENKPVDAGTAGSAGSTGSAGAAGSAGSAGSPEGGDAPAADAASSVDAAPPPGVDAAVVSPCAGVCVEIGGSVGHPATAVCSSPCVVGDDPECPGGFACALLRKGSGGGDQGFCAELCDAHADCKARTGPARCDLAAKPRVGQGVCVYGDGVGDGGMTDAPSDASAPVDAGKKG